MARLEVQAASDDPQATIVVLTTYTVVNATLVDLGPTGVLL